MCIRPSKCRSQKNQFIYKLLNRNTLYLVINRNISHIVYYSNICLSNHKFISLVRDFPYITSVKELVGQVWKRASFVDVQYYIYADIVGWWVGGQVGQKQSKIMLTYYMDGPLYTYFPAFWFLETITFRKTGVSWTAQI